MGLIPCPRRTQRAPHDPAVGEERTPQPLRSPEIQKLLTSQAAFDTA